MKPKKVILCVEPDEITLSLRVFVLETRGYRVLRAEGLAAALAIVRVRALLEPTLGWSVNLLLGGCDAPGFDGGELVKWARSMQPGLRTLLVDDAQAQAGTRAAADVVLPAQGMRTTELLEAVRSLISKRGPKRRAALDLG